eukprot:TRINITY_DN636_c0_g1_i1.p1 TRINITY_DN636_c0_g1~~TRINITY_DN636_c0_g1_i1.p1  ORF type:complete len:1055 (+),score=263.00 TRINITY_DN636_c0_g1_i1:97-3261(+)
MNLGVPAELVHWLPATDEYGRLYWFNTLTNATSWECPVNLPVPPMKPPPLFMAAPTTVPCYSADGTIHPVAKSSLISPMTVDEESKIDFNSTTALVNRTGSMSEFPTQPQRQKIKKERLQIDKTPVEGLIDFPNLPWEFEDNEAVLIYRIKASRINRRAVSPSAMYFAFPRFLTDAPLPNTKIKPVRVLLPKGANKNLNFTKIQITFEDTAVSAMMNALKKCVDASFPAEDCLFKVSGREEYVYGDIRIVDFEYVNYQIRHNEEIRLQLMHVPDFQRIIANVQGEIDAEFREPPYQESISTQRVPELDAEEESKDLWGSWDKWPYIPASKLDLPFRVRICGLDNLEYFPRFNPTITHVYVKFQMYLGVNSVRNSQFETGKYTTAYGEAKFYTWFSLNWQVQKLPWATKLAFLVYGINTENKEVLLGFVLQQLYNYKDCLISGQKALRLWVLPNEKSLLDELHFLKRGSSQENLSSTRVPVLHVKFDEFSLPVISRPILTAEKSPMGHRGSEANFNTGSKAQLGKILQKTILEYLNDEEKQVLWGARRSLMDNPNVLPKLLTAVDWSDANQANEARCLMFDWAKFTKPVDALQLLDAQFIDPFVRKFAVDCLANVSDSELSDLLLELVQCLKYEPQNWSYLGNFLVDRAIRNPYQVGHFLFWNLKAELHNPDYCERFALIIEEYLVQNARHAKELHIQNIYVQKFLEVADLITKYKHVDKRDKAFCMSALKEELQLLNRTFPDKYQIPLNPRWQASSIIVEECKYMSSKKLPLWLVFENADEEGEKMLVIFKSGDDLRQDMLTLQFIKTMDKLWLKEGLDMRMKPYTCVATGVNPENEGVGMIEIVVKSATISRIQIEEGGGAMGALRLNPLDDYIKKHNTTESSYDQAVQNFIRSCAGYCVATFVLGIGDRHNDNIMMTQSGHLFHIDFGHFLGNFKSKFGFKRERALFVFTPEMAHVMGGMKSDTYREFEKLCCDAFNVLRKYSPLLMNLFQLMQCAGMPELTSEEDIDYLRERLCLEDNEEGAAKKFQKEMVHSHSDIYRRVDNAIHNAKHA